MKRPGVLLLPPDAFPSQGSPPNPPAPSLSPPVSPKASLTIYPHIFIFLVRERHCKGVSFLAQEHNTTSWLGLEPRHLNPKSSELTVIVATTSPPEIKLLNWICFHSCLIKTEICLSYLNVILNSYFVIAKSNCPLQCPRFHISVLFIQVTVFLLHSCYKVERLTSTVPRTVLKTVLVTLHCQVFKTVAIKGVILHTVSLSGKAVLFNWTWLYCAHIWLAASIVCEKYAIQYPTGDLYRLQKRHPSKDITERR